MRRRACLTADQPRAHARILVRAAAVEPGPGWPCQPIVGELSDGLAMTLAQRGVAIVSR